MTSSNNQSSTHLSTDSNFLDSTSLSFFEDSIGQYSDFTTNADLENFLNLDPLTPGFSSLGLDAQTPAGYSPDNNSNSNQQEISNTGVQDFALTQSYSEQIEIIAEPYYGKKLRYRTDYNNNDQRQGVLKNRTKNSNYNGPAIRIPQKYLDPNQAYHVRVCLVTVINDKTNLRYIHPYSLEHTTDDQLNDLYYNSVYVPIQKEDYITGTKSFPSIRIVKKLQNELKAYGDLRIFDCYDSNVQDNAQSQQLPPKQLKKGYSLEKSQLAFTIVKKEVDQDQTLCITPFLETTAFSEIMIEIDSKGKDSENNTQPVNNRTNTSVPLCRVYKYAPRYSLNTHSEEMIIILTDKKLEPKKYGVLKVIFECDTVNPHWSQPVNDLTIKDQIVSFKIPIFPFQFNEIIPVNIILRQDTREIGTISYFYMPTVNQCSNCQLNAIINQNNATPNRPNKRMASDMFYMDDGVVPNDGNSPKLHESLSEPLPESSSTTTTAAAAAGTVSNSAPVSPIQTTQVNENPKDGIMQILSKVVESLFINNDDGPLLRLSRTFIKKQPQSLHVAISKNHIDILSKFIPIASIDILQNQNNMGENTLLHAVRLNHVEIVKLLLEKIDSEELMNCTDEKENNIFHIMALYSISTEIIDLIVDYCLKKSFSIQEKFDHPNQDHRTPLQLSISKNNLLVTKNILKYFKNNVQELKNQTGDNLIHLAVRYSDLEMIKYLIEDGKLDQIGNQSNLTMTPMELAQSLHLDDITEYLQTIYPLQHISDDTSSSDDDDDDDAENE
ncbi:hypothetical protein I4U23_007143 [Adineta vaga]|nr:hypothetical protein I4U23_007143 [Adineta vaga]